MKIPKLNRFRIALGAGILLTVLIVGGLGWAFVQQVSLAEELRGEVRQLEHAVATQEARQRYLTATLTYVHTDAYVEEWAREEARMAKPGEVVIIPLVEGGAPQPVSTPESPSEADEPVPDDDSPFWVVWWEALVGSK
jgi:cell division protein FtsB